MAFCTNCGHQLAAGAKFCFECGTKIGAQVESAQTQRKMVYDGEIHKCPNCGEILNAFVATCPACGYELRGTVSSGAVQAFANRLAMCSKTQDKATIIRNFPIPNTKEDVIEFMILASSNADSNLDEEQSAAWRVKIEQAYQKAQFVLKDNEELLYIQSVYNQVCTKLTKERKINAVKKAGSVISNVMQVLPKVILVSGWVISLLAFLLLCYSDDGYILLVMLDLVIGAMLIPLTYQGESPLPELISTIGIVISIVIILGLIKIDDGFVLALIVDVICSIIIFVRMLKKSKKNK